MPAIEFEFRLVVIEGERFPVDGPPGWIVTGSAVHLKRIPMRRLGTNAKRQQEHYYYR